MLCETSMSISIVTLFLDAVNKTKKHMFMSLVGP